MIFVVLAANVQNLVNFVTYLREQKKSNHEKEFIYFKSLCDLVRDKL